MQHTQNYQLSRWEKDDRIMMEDFNADNEKIDAALAAKADAEDVTALGETVAALTAGLGSGGRTARIAWGSYTGNGKYGSGNPNSLTFDFTPVLVVIGSAETTYSAAWPTVIIRGANSGHADSSAEKIQVTWAVNGLQWYSDSHPTYQNNYTGRTYCYVALGYSAE